MAPGYDKTLNPNSNPNPNPKPNPELGRGRGGGVRGRHGTALYGGPEAGRCLQVLTLALCRSSPEAPTCASNSYLYSKVNTTTTESLHHSLPWSMGAALEHGCCPGAPLSQSTLAWLDPDPDPDPDCRKYQGRTTLEVPAHPNPNLRVSPNPASKGPPHLALTLSLAPDPSSTPTCPHMSISAAPISVPVPIAGAVRVPQDSWQQVRRGCQPRSDQTPEHDPNPALITLALGPTRFLTITPL